MPWHVLLISSDVDTKRTPFQWATRDRDIVLTPLAAIGITITYLPKYSKYFIVLSIIACGVALYLRYLMGVRELRQLWVFKVIVAITSGIVVTALLHYIVKWSTWQVIAAITAGIVVAFPLRYELRDSTWWLATSWFYQVIVPLVIVIIVALMLHSQFELSVWKSLIIIIVIIIGCIILRYESLNALVATGAAAAAAWAAVILSNIEEDKRYFDEKVIAINILSDLTKNNTKAVRDCVSLLNSTEVDKLNNDQKKEYNTCFKEITDQLNNYERTDLYWKYLNKEAKDLICEQTKIWPYSPYETIKKLAVEKSWEKYKTFEELIEGCK